VDVDQAAVAECEARLRAAQLAGDPAELDRLLAADLRFVTPHGNVITRDDDLAAHRSGQLRFSRVELVELEVVPLAPDGAGTAGAAVARSRVALAGEFGGAFAGEFWYTRVWRRAGDGWELVAGHCGPAAA
jgi:hypothetical protein